MAKYSLILCIFAAHSACGLGAVVNLRSAKAQSNSTMPLIFSQSIWNNTITNYIQKEIHFKDPNPPEKNKAIWVFLGMFPLTTICGCDRCYMGQVTIGVIKGLTLGGCGILSTIDFWIACINGITRTKEVDLLGFHAIFEANSIEPAFYVGCIFLCFQILSFCMQIVQIRAQMQMQQQIMEQAMKNQEAAMNLERERLAAANRTANAKDKEDATPAETEKEAPGVVRNLSHNGLATMPTALASGLRKAGLVQEKPTLPELIAAFEKMDKDGDGQLDRDEIKEGLKAMGATDETIDEMIKCADTDGDGKISKNEFLVNLAPKL